MTRERFALNISRLKFIASKLGHLKNEFVFVGGSTTALFITDPRVPDIRTTEDVDCIVDVLSIRAYHKIEKQLRSLGFKQDISEGNVICRWHYEDGILDVMPAREKILHFGNIWYSGAIKYAINYYLSDALVIKTLTAPYFVATKLEAFNDRGNNDYLASHDLEDIITVIDGRVELIDEIANSEQTLKNYLTRTFSAMLQQDKFLTAIPGHLAYGPFAQERVGRVMKRIKDIVEL